jgi:hypothetical protein
LRQVENLQNQNFEQADTIDQLGQDLDKKDQDLAKKDQDLAKETQQRKQVPFDFFDGCSGWI